MSKNAYKLLLIAYSCEPGRGSEWGVGWSYVKDASSTQPVWVITHSENQKAFDRYLNEKHDGFPVHVTYVKCPPPLSWLNCSIYTLFNIHYYFWQFFAAAAARRIHKEVGIDLVQHVSLCRWWMHSAGATLTQYGVPFIFGPVAGGELMPNNLRKQMPFSSRWADFMRWGAREVWRHDPLLKKTARNAHIALAGTDASAGWMKLLHPKRLETQCCATSADDATVAEARKARENRPKDQPFTIMSCGGLSYYRGVDLAIRAFAKANLPNAQYIHVCNGAMRPTCEQLAKDLGVADRVHFLGDMPNVECLKQIARADVLSHTVIRDSQGVTCEALQIGIPAIVLDHLTPGLIVTEGCGYKIPITHHSTPEQLVDGIAAAYVDAYNNRDKLTAMAAACMERGADFTPAGRGRINRRVYERVLTESRQEAEALKHAASQDASQVTVRSAKP